MTRPFVFLDRDGTVIEDRHYAHRVEDCVLLPGALEGLQLLRAAGFGLAIVTNQSGLGRGYFERSDLERFHARLEQQLGEGGVSLDAIYVCPHHPDERCACRKPATGLLEQAEREHRVDLPRSWVVGDRVADVQLAEHAGCRGALVLTGKGEAERKDLADGVLVAQDLLEAARHIAARVGSQQPSR